jgi:hypothetical protein
MSEFIAKAQVVLGAVVTYLIAAGVGLGAAAGEISEAAPPGAEDAVAWLLRGVAALGTVVVVLRRVTEVSKELHGLNLPPGVVLRLVTERPDGSTGTVEKVA